MGTKSKLIYVSHFLSSWGDRMWRFAVALFLMDLDATTLLLPAIYGLTLAATVLVFGPLVGHWVDKTPRLRAAQASLVIQNLAVAVCAGILLVQKMQLIKGPEFTLIVKISAVVLGAIAQLASTASTIVVEKDWIVVIAGNDKDMLSTLNSVLRRIDLLTKLVAPLVCGQLMTLLSLTFGCGFVAGWNIISMFVEYILLRIVYNRTPELAYKLNYAPLPSDEEDCAPLDIAPPIDDIELLDQLHEDTVIMDGIRGREYGCDEAGADDDIPLISVEESETEIVESEEEPVKKSLCRSAFGFILVIPQGWSLYMSQSIAKAGMGLSCLYMTVLGFDSITVSYAYNQCFSELLVGILIAASAVTGIVATFLFSPIRSKVGLVHTGSFSSFAHILALVPCVVAVFAPGSPFILLNSRTTPDNVSTTVMTYTSINTTSDILSQVGNNASRAMPHEMDAISSPSVTATVSYAPAENTTSVHHNSGVFLKCIDGISPPSSYISLSMLMAGTIFLRIGLWGFDLTVTQLLQENVAENERGIVNGVQTSLNNMMDLLHFILVIALPDPVQFGYLVLLSSIFVCSGHVLYAVYARRATGRCYCC